jgi:hypothetical protein
MYNYSSQYREAGGAKETNKLLTRVWQELEYRIDVCRVPRGAHIEHP